MNQVQNVSFYGQTIPVFAQNNRYYVAMKPICENIGLDWRAQRKRIIRHDVMAEGVVMMTTPSSGGEQQTLCLPLDYLNGWLFGVEASRVKPEIRESLLRYQRECFRVLNEYFNPKAEQPKPTEALPPKASAKKSTVSERAALRAAVVMAVNKGSLTYADVYRMLHQRFGVESIDELSTGQLPEALHYVHSLAAGAANEALPPSQSSHHYFMLLAKMAHYADGYKRLQNLLYNKANSPESEQFFNDLSYSTGPDQTGFLFIFRPNIEADIEEAHSWLRRQSQALPC